MWTLILGGARSGKSRLAQQLASSSSRVAYIATAQAGNDAEMQQRILRHQSDRPQHWITIEEPLALGDAATRASAMADAVLIDCLTVWLSNVLWQHASTPGTSHSVDTQIQREIALLREAASTTALFTVSNEVGGGIVPEHPVAREFRDLQGLTNQWVAAAADRVLISIAGLPLQLKPSHVPEFSR